MIHHKPHSSSTPTEAPQTEGIVLHGAALYDLATNMLTFGQGKRLRNLTLDLALLRPGESLLDVGCGPGGVTLPAKQRLGSTGKAAGIDPSPEMIAQAQKNARRQGLEIDFRVGVIEDLPFSDASFDVVTASLMMHHLTPSLQVKGVAEIYRVLKPGGRLLIADMIRPQKSSSWQSILSRIMMHRSRQFAADDLLRLFTEAGFRKVDALKQRFLVIGFVRAIK